MSTNFKNIIRKTTPDQLNIDEENERLIIQDERTGEFHYEKSIGITAWSLLGRNYNYFVVNFTEFVKVSDLNCEISDPKEGMTIKLEFSFELSCIKGKSRKAIRFLKNMDSPNNLLERAFNKWVRDFVVDHPSFTNDFFLLEEKLRAHLENEASRKGLRIRILKLIPRTNDLSDFPPQHLTVVHATKCEILDDQIEVQNKIVLNLINRRVFSWRNIEDPESWIKSKADAIIQNELIGRTFKEVIDGFESDIKKKISLKLEEEIKGIGYSVQHIISVPSKEIADFLDGFKFDLKGNDIFATSDAEIKIRLDVNVEAKGTTIGGIDKKFIKPKKSIIEEVKKQTIESIGIALRSVDPEKCYTSFDSVRHYIAKEVVYQLDDNFKLDSNEFKISIGFLTTDLKERFDRLFAERGSIRIKSKSDATYYDIKYGVQSVNDWHVFHKNHIKYNEKTEEEYRDISDYIKNKIELDLQRWAAKRIELVNTKNLDKVITNLYKEALSIIKEEFGLQLGLPRLTRVSGSDLDDGGIFAEVFLAKRDQIKIELKEAVMADDDELIEELTEKLHKVRKNLNGIAESHVSTLGGDTSIKIENTNEEE